MPISSPIPRSVSLAMLVGLMLGSPIVAAQPRTAPPPTAPQIRAQLEAHLRRGASPLVPIADSLLGLMPDTIQRTECLSIFELQGLALLDANAERFFTATAQHRGVGHARSAPDSLSALITQRLATPPQVWLPWLDTLSNAEQRQVLALFTASTSIDSPPAAEQRRAARAFMRANPNSDYYSYVEDRRAQLNAFHWFAHAGYGAMVPSGSVAEQAQLRGGLSVGTGGQLNRLHLSVGATMGSGILRHEAQQVRPDQGAPFDAPAGAAVRYMHVSGRVGLQAYSSRRLGAVVLACLNSLNLSLPPQEGRNSESCTVASATGVGLGAVGQLELLRWGSDAQSTLGLHLGLGYTLLLQGGSIVVLEAGLCLSVGR